MAAPVAASLAADDASMPQQLQRLALCQDSWLEWKSTPDRAKPIANYLRTQFRASKDGGGAQQRAAERRLGIGAGG